MYYSTDIFANATGDSNAAFKASVWIGLVNLLSTFVAIGLVDKLGRKPLLLVGNVLQVIALGSVGLIYSSNPDSPTLLGFVILYIAAIAMAMGPLPWVICSEIFPARLRGRAMSIATLFVWMSCLIGKRPCIAFRQRGSHVPSWPRWRAAARCAIIELNSLLDRPFGNGESREVPSLHGRNAACGERRFSPRSGASQFENQCQGPGDPQLP